MVCMCCAALPTNSLGATRRHRESRLLLRSRSNMRRRQPLWFHSIDLGDAMPFLSLTGWVVAKLRRSRLNPCKASKGPFPDSSAQGLIGIGAENGQRERTWKSEADELLLLSKAKWGAMASLAKGFLHFFTASSF